MNNYNYLICLVCIFFFTTCDTNTNSDVPNDEFQLSDNPLENLLQIWQLSEYETLPAANQDLSRDQTGKLDKQLLRKGMQLVFLPDNTGHSIIDNVYEIFEWKIDPVTAALTLEKENGSSSFDNVVFEKAGKRAKMYAIENGIAKAVFISSSGLVAPITEEPFHHSNNQWRIKSKKHEEEIELKKRLLNFITHNKLLFKASVKNTHRSFTNSKSDGPINIYKGAIGYKKESALPSEWIYTFYDEYQAEEAYKLLVKYMKNRPMKKEVKGDWKATNLEILQELEAIIKADINKE